MVISFPEERITSINRDGDGMFFWNVGTQSKTRLSNPDDQHLYSYWREILRLTNRNIFYFQFKLSDPLLFYILYDTVQHPAIVYFAVSVSTCERRAAFPLRWLGKDSYYCMSTWKPTDGPALMWRQHRFNSGLNHRFARTRGFIFKHGLFLVYFHIGGSIKGFVIYDQACSSLFFVFISTFMS